MATAQKIEEAVKFLQSLATLSVQTQRYLYEGHFGTAADMLTDMESDLERASALVRDLDAKY